MATVRIAFNGGNVPIVTGDVPPDPETPIAEPTQTDFMTNQAFMVPEGMYCYGLDTASAHAPLWQIVQAVDGEETAIVFRRIP